MALYDSLLELVRRTSTDLPQDLRTALSAGRARETVGSTAESALGTIACNIDEAQEVSLPLCQDTGMIKFYVHAPVGLDQLAFEEEARRAVVEATALGYLRQNSVDSLTGKNSGNNLGPGTPLFHFRQWREPHVEVKLMLKGGGCENVGAQYALPTELKEFSKRANRDLEGAKLVTLHALWLAQGKGCAPGYLGVCIGADRASGLEVAKEQLLRTVDDVNDDPRLAAFEREVADIANGLGVGPMGFGGKTTVLGVKATVRNRLPASFFVSISYACWAHRRRGMVMDPQGTVKEWLY